MSRLGRTLRTAGFGLVLMCAASAAFAQQQERRAAQQQRIDVQNYVIDARVEGRIVIK